MAFENNDIPTTGQMLVVLKNESGYGNGYEKGIVYKGDVPLVGIPTKIIYDLDEELVFNFMPVTLLKEFNPKAKIIMVQKTKFLTFGVDHSKFIQGTSKDGLWAKE